MLVVKNGVHVFNMSIRIPGFIIIVQHRQFLKGFRNPTVKDASREQTFSLIRDIGFNVLFFSSLIIV